MSERTDRADENIKRPTLDVRCAAEVDQLDVAFSIQNDVFVLDVSVDHLGFGVQMMHCLGNLDKDLPALLLLHIDPKLNVVEQIHARQAVRYHFNVVIGVVLEEVRHLDNVGVLETVSSQIVHDMDLQRHCPQPAIPRPGVYQNASLRDEFDDLLNTGLLVSTELDLAIRPLAHIFDDNKVTNGLLPRWLFDLVCGN